MAKSKSVQRMRTRRGFRLDCILYTGERRFVNIPVSSEALLLQSVRALGAKGGWQGIEKVLSYEPHTWQEPMVSLDIFSRNLSV
jgi:hypothetical protein